MRIERVIDITGQDGKYQNIKIAVEADTPEECLKEIYKAFFMDRALMAMLIGATQYPLAQRLKELEEALTVISVAINQK